MKDVVVVLVTCGAPAEAARIARALVEGRLAACVNVLQTKVTSTYRWKGKVETARELLLLIKTSRGRLARVEQTVKRLHSYTNPELIALPIVGGSRTYLAWVKGSLLPAGSSPSKKSRASRGRKNRS